MAQLMIPSTISWQTPRGFCQDIVTDLKGKKILLVMNVSSVKRFSLQKWLKELKKNNLLIWLDNVPSNPTHTDIKRALKLCGGDPPEIIIALGGGSIIDMAKAYVAFSYLLRLGDFASLDIIKSIETKEYLKYPSLIPIYAIPTTAGTGSEVTRWATVWDMEKQTKYSLEAPWLCPQRAYIVPQYTCSMPKRLTLSTGLDALCQATEAYWAKASNPMVKEISKIAIRLLIKYLPQVLSDGDNLYFREKVCLGSVFAGLAFSNTRTTACHSISYPLTMCFGVPHGLACALSLTPVMRMNLPVVEEPGALLKAFGVASPKELQLWLDNLAGDIVKLRLSAFGIQESDIVELVKLSFTQGRMDNNPVAITPDDVREILYSLL